MYTSSEHIHLEEGETMLARGNENWLITIFMDPTLSKIDRTPYLQGFFFFQPQLNISLHWFYVIF